MNLERPEANNGFEVSEIRKVEHNNFERDGFIIRRATAPGTEDDWQAFLPLQRYPSLANRAILIQGPSQDYWHQKASRYHQISFCATSKTAHQKLETALDKHPDRKVGHWLLVFGGGIVLENHVFSGDAVQVRSDSSDMVENLVVNADTDEAKVVKLLGSSVYWRIAKQGGDMIRTPDRAPRKRFAQLDTGANAGANAGGFFKK